MELEYSEAARYCMDLLEMRKAIQAAIDKNRHKLMKNQIKTLRKVVPDFNPEGDEFTKAMHQELPSVIVQYGKMKDTFRLERPESWVQTFKQANSLYRSVYGHKALVMIALRYGHDWSVYDVCLRFSTTRETFYNMKHKYAQILLLMAVQNGLVTVINNTKRKEDELNGTNQ